MATLVVKALKLIRCEMFELCWACLCGEYAVWSVDWFVFIVQSVVWWDYSSTSPVVNGVGRLPTYNNYSPTCRPPTGSYVCTPLSLSDCLSVCLSVCHSVI